MLTNMCNIIKSGNDVTCITPIILMRELIMSLEKKSCSLQ